MIKLISWNVNGLRACCDKGFRETFQALDADFFCLQETKMQEGQLDLSFDGYESYWNYAEKKGYSGTAIFTRRKPLSVTYGLDIEEHDREGRVITLEMDDFFLVTVYTPNSQDGLRRLDYRMTWEDAFRDYLLRLDARKPVIVCGDMNVAHQEIDLKNPKSNRKNAGFTDEERAKFQQLLDAGFTDTFRYFYPDQTDIYSWWSYRFKAREKNAGWRIDYFVVSNRLRERLAGAKIHTEILGSDHCPVAPPNPGPSKPPPKGRLFLCVLAKGAGQIAGNAESFVYICQQTLTFKLYLYEKMYHDFSVLARRSRAAGANAGHFKLPDGESYGFAK